MMNNEELERRMAFIVEQQAQFATDIQQLKEVQVQTENVVGQLAAATLEGFKDVNAKIDALVNAQIRLNESQAQLRNEPMVPAKAKRVLAALFRIGWSIKGESGSHKI
jgi:uncharacterized protein YehS (DUF1456 family)